MAYMTVIEHMLSRQLARLARFLFRDWPQIVAKQHVLIAAGLTLTYFALSDPLPSRRQIHKPAPE